MSSQYVQYGCGTNAPKEWANFDASPSLRIQKTPIINVLLRKFQHINFPKNVLFGDIVKGLPIKYNSCIGVYCSHVLEHLAFEDCFSALQNTYNILKPEGLFRLVMPDLQNLINVYGKQKESGDYNAATYFMSVSQIGTESRPRGIRAIIESTFGNRKHLWLWDNESIIFELHKIGFKDIRKCDFGDSSDKMFKLVEDSKRFETAIALEMTK